MSLSYRVFFFLNLFIIQSFAQQFHSGNRFLIPWSAEKKLTWKDFKGRNLNPFLHYAAVCEARIMVIPFYENNNLNFKVVSFFDQLKSWSVDTTNDLLLEHEQLHFDITELFARKIRQALKELLKNKATSDKDFQQLIDRLLLERDQYNKMFDDGTNYGTNKTKQMELRSIIHNSLKELGEFPSP